MVYPRGTPLFENRYDAGRQLAEKLSEYRGQPVVVLAIPNGGLPVALQAALALEVDLDVVISRKLPIPLRPEGGFGAIADDGAAILNEPVVKEFGLTQEQINYEANKVRLDIRQRSLLYRGNRPLTPVSGKTVIIIDDGLASGFTMMVAIDAIHGLGAGKLMIAVPTAPEDTVLKVAERVDAVYCPNIREGRPYAVADAYRDWHDVTEDEAAELLARYSDPGV